ncbi:MAG TPA: hypothetical protein VL992_01690 [Tepidisphaeraceae bacterium]|nr:hypothetical protein [Tepidisphaeraceae bacterium]
MRLFKRSNPPLPAPPVLDRVPEFLAALAELAPMSGCGTYRFDNPDGACRGFVQFCTSPVGAVTIHRLWTPSPGHGNGSLMLQALCDLADIHGVHILLKALPFGAKPYPMSRQLLADWYRRHGFEGTHRRMARTPRAINVLEPA